MYRDVGMAMPKTPGTRLYMYGSVQARQIIERLHKYIKSWAEHVPYTTEKEVWSALDEA